MGSCDHPLSLIRVEGIRATCYARNILVFTPCHQALVGVTVIDALQKMMISTTCTETAHTLES